MEPLFKPDQVWVIHPYDGGDPACPKIFVASKWTDEVHPEWPRFRITAYELASDGY